MRLLRNKWFVALILFLLSFGAYIPSLRSDFVWDDVETIERSYYIFNASSIHSIVLPELQKDRAALYYRPVIYGSMVLDKGVWGISPFGFHFSNVLFNAVSAVLFFFLALLLLKEFNVSEGASAALISGVLFALYPMHVESVSWVSGRTDVLCGLFFFLAFIFHILSYRRLIFLVPAAAGFSLSLLSKEVAVVFPFTVLAFDLLSRRLGHRDNTIKYAVYFGLLILYSYLRSRAFINIPDLSGERIPGESAAEGAVSGASEFAGVLKVILGSYLFYFKKLVFPFTFNAFVESVQTGFVSIISSIGVFLTLFAISFFSVMKRRSLTAFSILWVVITLSPSVLVALFGIASSPVAERYLYIPSAGLSILFGYCIFQLGTGMRIKRASWVLAFLLAAVYLLFTVHRQSAWDGRLSLWEDTSRKSPSSPITHINYGMALLDAGREDEALGELLKNFDADMKITDAARSVTANNIGVVYINKEDLGNAEKWFLRAYSYDPDYYKSIYHLGLINYMKGYSDNSEAYYRASEGYLGRALGIRPSYGKAYLLLAMVYMELGDTEKARHNAGLALKSGLTESAARRAEKILETEN